MLSNFKLPNWFEAPENIKNEILYLWNKSYSELYDEEFTDNKVLLTTGELEIDIIKLITLYGEEDNEETFRRVMFFNWALCKAAQPKIDAYLANNLAYKSIFNSLESWSHTFCLSEDFTRHNLSVDGEYAVAESVAVYQNMIEISKRKNIIDILVDSVDCCVQGEAICHGSQDNRAIFNWLLIDVFPSAYCFKLPDFIYTGKFDIENWNYFKKIELGSVPDVLFKE